MAKKRKGILILNNWFDLMIDILSPEQTIEILKLIRAKGNNEFYETSDIEVKTHWFHMQYNVEASIEKYAELCERNRKNGGKGGAPKGNQNARKNNPNNPNQPKQAKEKDMDKETYPSDMSSSAQHPFNEDVSPEEAFNELFNN